MKLIKTLLIAFSLMTLSVIAVMAASVTDRSAFSGDETVITFAELDYGEAATTQYSDLGVTLNGAWGAIEDFDGAFPWPGSGGQILGNFTGSSCPCETITATFDNPVSIVGGDFITAPGATLVLDAYSGGSLVESASFSTDLTASFAGIQVDSGFDTLTIRVGSFFGDALLMDDLTFELGASTREGQLGGAPGKGLSDAPGLEKEFNPKSAAAENAGKKN